MRNNEYFSQSEDTCWELLLQFNTETHIFKELIQSPKGHHVDCSGITQDGRVCSIELKKRNAILTQGGKFKSKTFQDETLYIEAHKMGTMQIEIMQGNIPLYINFLENGVVVIYVLNRLSTLPTLEKKTIPSQGYGKFEIGHRMGLNITDAIIYKNNKLIKRMGEKWKTKTNS